jgi:hypothetical protein
VRRIGLLVLAAIAALGALTTSAQAQITVGQVAPVGGPVVSCSEPTAYDEIQTATGGGASYVVPSAGVLTSWSTQAGTATNQVVGFKVFRPIGVGSYTVVGVDGPRILASGVLNTVPIDIPVQAGDVIGLSIPSAAPASAPDCWFETTNPGDIVGWRAGFTPVGGSLTVEGHQVERRLNVSATLLPPPAIAGIAPAEGSIAGGTSVAITGANFASVTGVNFGTTPAASVTVGSEGQITAVAPPSATVVSVPVTVTTAAGTATAAQPFAYKGCVVPKLNHRSLKAAKKQALKADCKVGKVKLRGDATPKDGKVVKQRPKPGAVLVPGSKINLTLG